MEKDPQINNTFYNYLQIWQELKLVKKITQNNLAEGNNKVVNKVKKVK